jgi:hypothetical protein
MGLLSMTRAVGICVSVSFVSSSKKGLLCKRTASVETVFWSEDDDDEGLLLDMLRATIRFRMLRLFEIKEPDEWRKVLLVVKRILVTAQYILMKCTQPKQTNNNDNQETRLIVKCSFPTPTPKCEVRWRLIKFLQNRPRSTRAYCTIFNSAAVTCYVLRKKKASDTRDERRRR